MIHEVNTEKQLLTRTQQPEIKEMSIEETNEHSADTGQKALHSLSISADDVMFLLDEDVRWSGDEKNTHDKIIVLKRTNEAC